MSTSQSLQKFLTQMNQTDVLSSVDWTEEFLLAVGVLREFHGRAIGEAEIANL